MSSARLWDGYNDRRMFRIFLIGAISGFPWVLIGSALSLWLKEDGLSRSTVGFAGLIFGVYAVNFLWAPLIDRIRLPWLSARIGARKAWIMLFQAVIILALMGWTMLEPTAQLELVIFLGLIIAIASASQDITIDALRIEQAASHEKAVMAAGAAMAVIGWWSGFKLGGLVTFFIADALEAAGHANYWQMTFMATVGMMVLMNIGLLFIPEAMPEKRPPPRQQAGMTAAVDWIRQTVVEPLWSFFRNNGLAIGLGLVGFIFLFKIGEAFLGKMSIIFYREMGFSKSDIGIYSKGLGWITTVTFTLIGGWFAIKAGSLRALLLSGIAMAGTNIIFAILFWVGKSTWLFALAVVLDDLAAAFATVAFVTFISLLVDRNYTATQYALLASIGTAGKTLLASSSGALVDWLEGDWGVFFIITAVMVVPSLLILLRLGPYLRDAQSG